MDAMDRLPAPEAREACRELAKATVWPAEEWAIATMKLVDWLLPMDEMGMARLIQLTLATKAPPSVVADRMVLEYSKALVSPESTA